MALDVGDSVPTFKLPSSSGKEVSLADYKGKKIVLYFYPKDDTPGCTTEACEFRDNLKNYADVNAVVIGVSKDPLKSHDKFIEKYGLPFELISDEEGKMLEAFGVWKKEHVWKNLSGCGTPTFHRRKRKIAKSWRKVSVPNHVATVLEEAKSL
jgi:peroxiredoxin Q/BCP